MVGNWVIELLRLKAKGFTLVGPKIKSGLAFCLLGRFNSLVWLGWLQPLNFSFTLRSMYSRISMSWQISMALIFHSFSLHIQYHNLRVPQYTVRSKYYQVAMAQFPWFLPMLWSLAVILGKDHYCLVHDLSKEREARLTARDISNAQRCVCQFPFW